MWREREEWEANKATGNKRSTFLIKSSGSTFKFAWKIHELGLRCLYNSFGEMKSIAELKSTRVFNMKWNQKEKQQILIPNRARRNLKCMFTFHSRPLQSTPIQTQKRRLSAPSPLCVMEDLVCTWFMNLKWNVNRINSNQRDFYGAQQSNRGDQVPLHKSLMAVTVRMNNVVVTGIGDVKIAGLRSRKGKLLGWRSGVFKLRKWFEVVVGTFWTFGWDNLLRDNCSWTYLISEVRA